MVATGSFDATVGIWRRWDSYGQEGGDSLKPSNGVEHDDDGDEDMEEDEEEEEWRFAVLLDGHDSEVKSVSWSPSGMLLATCSRDKSIWIWEDLDDGDNNFETVAVMQEHGGDVKCVAWHPVEECLASASYDDTIRLWREDIDDWGQVGCIRGHEGTVWFIDWEGVDTVPSLGEGEDIAARWRERRALSGPRIVSCSDDRTVRIWRRLPKEQKSGTGDSAMPSIIRPTGTDEQWEEEAVLPQTHDLSVYAVAWSKKTGLVASVGSDGRIVVYEERFTSDGGNGDGSALPNTPGSDLQTEWVNVATIEGGHGIYEINHVSWAKRADRGREDKDEEVLLTTADDGSVKVWTLH